MLELYLHEDRTMLVSLYLRKHGDVLQQWRLFPRDSH